MAIYGGNKDQRKVNESSPSSQPFPIIQRSQRIETPILDTTPVSAFRGLWKASTSCLATARSERPPDLEKGNTIQRFKISSKALHIYLDHLYHHLYHLHLIKTINHTERPKPQINDIPVGEDSMNLDNALVRHLI